MVIRLLLIFLGCFQVALFSCKKRETTIFEKSTNPLICSNITADIIYARPNVVCHFKTTRNTFTFHWNTILSEGGKGISSIEVYDLTGKEKIQTIMPPKQFTFFDPIEFSEVFITEDMNFDGYEDIRLINQVGKKNLRNYSYWFYDSKTGQFKLNRNTGLESLKNPSFDAIEKTVHSWWATEDGSSGHGLYLWRNGRIQLSVEKTGDRYTPFIYSEHTARECKLNKRKKRRAT